MTLAQLLRQENRQEGVEKDLHDSILDALESAYLGIPVREDLPSLTF